MSALGHKQTSETHTHNVRFAPESGHSKPIIVSENPVYMWYIDTAIPTIWD